eukprot:TRINITY_DN1173_c0_g1_i2.p1 TRINITY_DN1173_c0_g1~~TRINITY_DN1173_c0_g1_i2.p1  ORF type:complete len:326 (-),score=58.99 TRINITY_DN1173_c0_g1_i2:587-1564(-)
MSDQQVLGKRDKLCSELLTSEKAHVQALNALFENYIQPLRDGTILPTNIFQEIFSNLELIRSWHATFYEGLNTHLACGDTFGDFFMDMTPLLRQLYTQYNENYDHAMEALENAKKIKGFASFLEKKQKEISENKIKDLLTYLYLPIQRMITYDSLVKDILALTPSEHEDHMHLSTVYKALREMQDHANQRSKQRKNIDKVIEIQNSISGDTQLALPHRRYVFEGEVGIGKGQKERRMFLFNDLLLCAKKRDKKGKGKPYEIDFTEPLETLKAEAMTDGDSRKFRLYSSAREYIVFSDSAAQWIKLITETAKFLKASKFAYVQREV